MVKKKERKIGRKEGRKEGKISMLKVAELSSPRVFEMSSEKWRVAGLWPSRGSLRKCNADIPAAVWDSGLLTPCPPGCLLDILDSVFLTTEGSAPVKEPSRALSSLTPPTLSLSDLLCSQSVAQCHPFQESSPDFSLEFLGPAGTHHFLLLVPLDTPAPC